MKFLSLFCLALLTGFLAKEHSFHRPQVDLLVPHIDRVLEFQTTSQAEAPCVAEKASSTPLPGQEPELIYQTTANSILIQAPYNFEGEICLDLAKWDLDRQILVIAYGEGGIPIEESPYQIRTDHLTFSYQQTLGGQPVEFYEITQDPLEQENSEQTLRLPPAWQSTLPIVILVTALIHIISKRK